MILGRECRSQCFLTGIYKGISGIELSHRVPRESKLRKNRTESSKTRKAESRESTSNQLKFGLFLRNFPQFLVKVYQKLFTVSKPKKHVQNHYLTTSCLIVQFRRNRMSSNRINGIGISKNNSNNTVSYTSNLYIYLLL